MPGSTLDPDNINPPDRQLGRGHGTGAMGPSDTSDSDSDLQGASGTAGEDKLRLGGGTTSDVDENTAGGSAGPDVGDADLDSDTDAAGTGERATAGRDTVAEDGQDMGTDRVFRVEQDDRDDPTGYQPSLKRSHERPDRRG